jgi:glutamate--cysteine ligase
MSDPVGRSELIEDLEGGCKPPADWRIGLEHECFLYRRGDATPPAYEGPGGIRALLSRLKTPGRREVLEAEALVGLESEAGGLSLEPGGQFEFAAPPLASVAEVARALAGHLHESAAAAAELDLGLLTVAFPPEWRRAQMARTRASQHADAPRRGSSACWSSAAPTSGPRRKRPRRRRSGPGCSTMRAG